MASNKQFEADLKAAVPKLAYITEGRVKLRNLLANLIKLKGIKAELGMDAKRTLHIPNIVISNAGTTQEDLEAVYSILARIGFSEEKFGVFSKEGKGRIVYSGQRSVDKSGDYSKFQVIQGLDEIGFDHNDACESLLMRICKAVKVKARPPADRNMSALVDITRVRDKVIDYFAKQSDIDELSPSVYRCGNLFITINENNVLMVRTKLDGIL